MGDKKVIVTFSLTRRAAAIAEGWQVNREASALISKLIENQADGHGDVLFDMSKVGDKRMISGHECVKSASGQWLVVE